MSKIISIHVIDTVLKVETTFAVGPSLPWPAASMACAVPYILQHTFPGLPEVPSACQACPKATSSGVSSSHPQAEFSCFVVVLVDLDLVIFVDTRNYIAF